MNEGAEQVWLTVGKKHDGITLCNERVLFFSFFLQILRENK